MKFDMTSMDGRRGSLELDDAIFVSSRARISSRACALAARQAPGGDHKTLGRADIHRTGKKMYKQKHRRPLRSPACRSSARRPGDGPVLRTTSTPAEESARARAAPRLWRKFAPRPRGVGERGARRGQRPGLARVLAKAAIANA